MRKWAFLKLFVTTFWLQIFLCSAQTPVANRNATPLPSAADAAFEKLKSLEGTWEAPLHGQQEGKVMVNKFHVIGDGSAVLHSEWLDGNQLTTTVFYMVGPELRADHYCDLQNQPRYVAKPSADGSVVEFVLRDITNLDAHPRHFHSTTWHFVDGRHLTQDWEIAEGSKPPKFVRMEFTRE